MKNRYLFLAGLLCLWGCKGTGNSSPAADITAQGDRITVAEASPVLQRIETRPVVPTRYNARFSTSGTVRAIPSSYAEISVPFAGRVLKSFVRLGQRVAKGTPLFELGSSDYYDACRDYFDAVRERELAEKSLARTKDLLLNRVASVRDAEQMQTECDLKRQAEENAVAALRVFGVDTGSLRLGDPLIVRAPIAGKVVADRIVIGQYVEQDAGPLAVVADLKKVWVVANVKEKDLRLIERLQEVEIALAASPEEPVRGRLCHIGDLLDETTRSVEVIVECDNRDGRMKPNMYGTVLLTDTPVDAILIPTSAILQREDCCYVLKAEGDRSFRCVPVTVVATEGDRSVIGEGLAQGDRIVVKGAFYLLDAK